MDSDSRSRDFSDLGEMNGVGCGSKQARILLSYENWGFSQTLFRPSGRKVDGLARLAARQQTVLVG